MNRGDFDRTKEFSPRQLAELFDRTVVRIWQLIKANVVKFTAAENEQRRSKIMVPRSQLKVLMKYFQVEKLRFDRGRPRQAPAEAN